MTFVLTLVAHERLGAIPMCFYTSTVRLRSQHARVLGRHITRADCRVVHLFYTSAGFNAPREFSNGVYRFKIKSVAVRAGWRWAEDSVTSH